MSGGGCLVESERMYRESSLEDEDGRRLRSFCMIVPSTVMLEGDKGNSARLLLRKPHQLTSVPFDLFFSFSAFLHVFKKFHYVL